MFSTSIGKSDTYFVT